MSGLSIRLMLYSKSWALSFLPSLQVTSGRRLNVYVMRSVEMPPFANEGMSLATSAFKDKSWSKHSRPSKTCTAAVCSRDQETRLGSMVAGSPARLIRSTWEVVGGVSSFPQADVKAKIEPIKITKSTKITDLAFIVYPLNFISLFDVAS